MTFQKRLDAVVDKLCRDGFHGVEIESRLYVGPDDDEEYGYRCMDIIEPEDTTLFPEPDIRRTLTAAIAAEFEDQARVIASRGDPLPKAGEVVLWIRSGVPWMLEIEFYREDENMKSSPDDGEDDNEEVWETSYKIEKAAYDMLAYLEEKYDFGREDHRAFVEFLQDYCAEELKFLDEQEEQEKGRSS